MTEQEKGLAKRLLVELVDAGHISSWSYSNKVLEYDPSNWNSDRYGVGVELQHEGSVAKVTISDMYDWNLEFDALEIISKVFGSKKINLDTVEGYSSGCGTCGYGGRHQREIFVINPVLE